MSHKVTSFRVMSSNTYLWEIPSFCFTFNIIQAIFCFYYSLLDLMLSYLSMFLFCSFCKAFHDVDLQKYNINTIIWWVCPSKYTFLVPCWTPFCCQCCLYSLWHRENKVLETFFDDICRVWEVSGSPAQELNTET